MPPTRRDYNRPPKIGPPTITALTLVCVLVAGYFAWFTEHHYVSLVWSLLGLLVLVYGFLAR